MSQLYPASRGLSEMKTGPRQAGSDLKLEVNPHSGLLGQPSPSATILDTLKKKMNQLKDELESNKDENDRSRHQLEEEKRRREVVRLILLNIFIFYVVKELNRLL